MARSICRAIAARCANALPRVSLQCGLQWASRPVLSLCCVRVSPSPEVRIVERGSQVFIRRLIGRDAKSSRRPGLPASHINIRNMRPRVSPGHHREAAALTIVAGTNGLVAGTFVLADMKRVFSDEADCEQACAKVRGSQARG
jgi:hypothetical protein